MEFGEYTIQGELGRGASGVVYAGQHARGRPVAIKLLAAQRPEVLERFRREARLHERLGEEAGFVPFLDMGLVGGRPYLVMPLLSGGTLRDKLKAGPLGLRGTLELGQRLATALGRAHALGIVHRDIKPENILYSEGGYAYLADLGMAKHFRHDVTGASQSVVLSRAGEVRGTVSYMAPEQLNDASGVGPPADVFALAAVLYECLCGEPAFNGETLVELLVQVTDAIHVPLRKRSDCPGWIAALVEECLAKDPSRRPQEGAALAEALSAAPAKRRRLLLPFAALALAGGLGAWFALGPEAQGGGGEATPLASLTSAPEPTPGRESAPSPARSGLLGEPLAEFPPAWAPLTQGAKARLVRAWAVPDVSHAGTLGFTEEGILTIGERSVYLLREGPAIALTQPLPTLRRDSTLGKGNTLLLLLEHDKLTTISLRDGLTRHSVSLKTKPRLATLGFRGIAAVTAEGNRLATYPCAPGGKAAEFADLDFSTLPADVHVLAASDYEVLAGYGDTFAFVDAAGSARGARTLASRVAALTYSLGAPRLALAAGKKGTLYCYGARRQLLGAPVETKLEPVQALAAGRTLAALASELWVAIVDLETQREIARLDLRALGSSLVSTVALSEDEATLAVGTEDGIVLEFELHLRRRSLPPLLKPQASWGETRGSQAGATVQVAQVGPHLVSSEPSGAIHVWDSGTGRALRTIRTGALGRARFAPTASGHVWTASEIRIQEWDLATGRELRRLPGGATIGQLSLREDERELACLDSGGKVRILDLATGRTRFTESLRRRDVPAALVELLPGGRLLVGYRSGELSLLDLSGRPEWTRRVGPQAVVRLEVFDKGSAVLVGTRDGSVTQWSLPGGEEQLRFQAEGITSLSRSGPHVLLGLTRGTFELRQASDGRRLWIQGSSVGVQPQVALVSGNRILAGGGAGDLRLLQLPSQGQRLEQVWKDLPPGRLQLALGYLPGKEQGTLSLATVEAQSIRRWDPSTGKAQGVQLLGGGLQAYLAGSTLLTKGRGPGAKGSYGVDRWTLGKGFQAQATRLLEPAPVVLALSADGFVAAYSHTSPEGHAGLEVYFLRRGEKRFLKTGVVQSAELSADGDLVAVTKALTGVELWATTGSRRLATYRRGVRDPLFLASNPPQLVLCVGRGRVEVLSPPTSEAAVLKLTPGGKQGFVRALAGSPTGKSLAIVAASGEVELWSVPGGELLARLAFEDPTDLPRALAFSPAGDQLAVLTGRGRVMVFQIPSALRR